MKRFLLFFGVLLQSSVLMSQSLAVAGTLAVTGDTVVYGLTTDFDVKSNLIVKNLSGDTSLVLCEKTVISQDTTGDNAFCWAGTCYGTGTMISPKIDTLDPGEQTDGFDGYFYPSWYSTPTTSVSAVVEYCFYPQSNTLDRTCITVTYNAMGPLAYNDISKQEKIGSFFPNPSFEYTSLPYHVKQSSILQFTDVLGNIVKVIELEGAGEKTIYTGDLHKGIYFGNLIQNGEIVKIKKLIINK